jgi:iron-sulfur cluster assembly protein/iron-sulfur cluster insertion protein
MEPQIQDCVTLAPEAVMEVQRMIDADAEPEGKALRVYVEQGGCSGMQYGLVFDERRDDDRVMDCAGVPVVVDAISADFLRGSVVNFSDDLNDSGFKIINPNAKVSCGCGKSFEV